MGLREPLVRNLDSLGPKKPRSCKHVEKPQVTSHNGETWEKIICELCGETLAGERIDFVRRRQESDADR